MLQGSVVLPRAYHSTISVQIYCNAIPIMVNILKVGFCVILPNIVNTSEQIQATPVRGSGNIEAGKYLK